MKAGYGISLETVVIKTAVDSAMQVPLFNCALFLPVPGCFGQRSIPGILLSLPPGQLRRQL